MEPKRLKCAHMTRRNEKFDVKLCVTLTFSISKENILRTVCTFMPEKAIFADTTFPGFFESGAAGVAFLAQIIKMLRQKGIDARLLSVNGVVGYKEALQNPYSVCLARWKAIGELAAWIGIKDGVIIDGGSTSMEFLGIRQGREVVFGKDFFTRANRGELFCLGGIHTNLSYALKKIKVDGRNQNLSLLEMHSARIGHVLRVLGILEHTCSQTDISEIYNEENSYKSIAFSVGGDTNLLSRGKIVNIAKQMYKSYLREIVKHMHLMKAQYERKNVNVDNAYLCGTAVRAILKPASEKVFPKTFLFSELLQQKIGITEKQSAGMEVALGCALLAEKNL